VNRAERELEQAQPPQEFASWAVLDPETGEVISTQGGLPIGGFVKTYVGVSPDDWDEIVARREDEPDGEPAGEVADTPLAKQD
jgi:hypothetical protein